MTRVLVIALVIFATIISIVSSRALDIKKWEDEAVNQKPQSQRESRDVPKQAGDRESKKPPSDPEPPLTRSERNQVTFNWWLIALNTLLAGFTLWYALMSTSQWRQMREANRIGQEGLDHARAVATDASRPWVGVAGIDHFPFPLAVGQKVRASIRLTNFGESPAQALETRAVAAVVEQLPTVDSLSFTPEAAGPNILFQGQPITMPRDTDQPLTQDQRDAIMAGTLYWVVAGRITYKDSTARGHTTDFCGVYDPTVGAFIMHGGMNSAT
jgi:hypothetical protein